MEAAEAGSVAVLAEKPSVARDIARVLGAGTKGDGYLHGNGYVVTWAIGHLAALAQPHEINPDWRQWRRDLLPMLPDQWPLVVYEKTKDQFETVKQDPQLAQGLAHRVRHRRRPRRRTDFPLHLRSRRTAPSPSAACGSPRSRRTPSAKASTPSARPPITTAWPTPPAAAAAPTGWWA